MLRRESERRRACVCCATCRAISGAGICSSSTTPGSLPRACSASASRVAAPSSASYLPPRHASTADSADSEVWDALMHPGQKLKPGASVRFEGDAGALKGEILDRRFFGRRTIRFGAGAWRQRDIGRSIAIGHVPLPPYIKRSDVAEDRERYQTVFARARGSIAAPTAGLHFTPQILDALDAAGVERAAITLHVGYGTFKPVRDRGRRITRRRSRSVRDRRSRRGSVSTVPSTRAGASLRSEPRRRVRWRMRRCAAGVASLPGPVRRRRSSIRASSSR